MADENYSYAPKYVQIQNYILQKIESGEYAAGDKIPSEIELCLLYTSPSPRDS